jgi:hypothetical protein
MVDASMLTLIRHAGRLLLRSARTQAPAAGSLYPRRAREKPCLVCMAMASYKPIAPLRTRRLSRVVTVCYG